MRSTPFSSAGAAAAVVLTLGIAALPPAVHAQARQASAPADTTQAAPAPAALHAQEAAETRREFYAVLDRYPPALGRVLRLDPTLLRDANYLASYPAVAAFVAQYPDVPRNPGYYLARYDGSFGIQEPLDANQRALAMWEDVLEFSGAFLVFSVIAFAVFHLIKYLVEYRRWSRISKINAEVHNKILDRFGSNEELLAYIDSPAGRRFLEAAPLAAGALPAPRESAPLARILLSVQVGLLLLALAVGLFVVSAGVIDEVKQPLRAFAVIGLFLGAGCVVSAGASYVLSRRLGLLQSHAAPPPQSA